MSTDPIDRILRSSADLRADAPASDACVEPDVLASLIDGSFLPDERRAAETHVAGCARCRAVLATIVRTEPAPTPAPPWWRRGWSLGWLVPVTAGAAALALWVALPEDPRRGAAPVEVGRQAAAPAQEAARVTEPIAPAEPPTPIVELELRTEPPVEEVEEVEVQRRAAVPAPELRREAATRPAAGAPAQSADAAEPLADQALAAPAAAPPVAPPAAAETFAVRSLDAAPIQIESPNPLVRWRIVPQAVERSTDAGGTWTSQITGTALTAGDAPAPSVCWLVGPDGLVLLTIDGENWQERRLPEPVDLVSVDADNARQATVTAADGRRFATTDGGATWNTSPLQGF